MTDSQAFGFLIVVNVCLILLIYLCIFIYKMTRRKKMLFTVLPVGYTEEKFPRLNVDSAVNLVWLDKDHADLAVEDTALEVWGVLADWHVDTFELNREEYPESKARGLRFNSPLVRLVQGADDA